MAKKLLATLPAALGALFLAACGDSPSSDEDFSKLRSNYEETYQAPRSEVTYQVPRSETTYAKRDYTQADKGSQELTPQQRQYIAALQRAQMAQRIRQAQMQQYARQMMAAQMLRNAYAQQQRSGGYNSTGSYRRPGSAFSTYDHTGTSAYSDGSGVVGVMTSSGSWYPGQ